MNTLDARRTAELTPYRALVDALHTAALEVSQGDIHCPHRQVLAFASGGALLSMIATAADLAVHKLVTFVPSNPARHMPAIQGHVSVWDAQTGSHVLTLDGATVTGRRTAALSMLGVSVLYPRPPGSFHIFGTGTQAAHHVEAITQLYPAAMIVLSGRTRPAAEEFCAKHAALSSNISASHSADPPDTDVVITCTTSHNPVYEAPASKERLIIATGSFTPEAAEIGAATVRASRIYVDTLEGARQEAGDLIRAGIDWASVHSLSQRLSQQDSPGGALLFKTVGLAAWDLAAARVAVTGRQTADMGNR